MTPRRPRQSDNHRAFPQPDEWGTPTWRYIDFAKFVSFLQNGLYLSRVDSLGDEWEGAFPSGTSTIFTRAANEIVARGEASWLESIRGSWAKSYGEARVRTFASCWQLAANDVWWMWKTYCESAYGVAIRSTYALLDSELPTHIDTRHVLIGKVTYGDYDSADYVTDPSNLFSAVMSKRDAFQDEREIRILCDLARAGENKRGFFINVDPARLLTKIIVSPISPAWFRETVEATTRAFGLNVPLEDSRLRREPTLPF